jgi:hypothetical protein
MGRCLWPLDAFGWMLTKNVIIIRIRSRRRMKPKQEEESYLTRIRIICCHPSNNNNNNNISRRLPSNPVNRALHGILYQPHVLLQIGAAPAVVPMLLLLLLLVIIIMVMGIMVDPFIRNNNKSSTRHSYRQVHLCDIIRSSSSNNIDPTLPIMTVPITCTIRLLLRTGVVAFHTVIMTEMLAYGVDPNRIIIIIDNIAADHPIDAVVIVIDETTIITAAEVVDTTIIEKMHAVFIIGRILVMTTTVIDRDGVDVAMMTTNIVIDQNNIVAIETMNPNPVPRIVIVVAVAVAAVRVKTTTIIDVTKKKCDNNHVNKRIIIKVSTTTTTTTTTTTKNIR